MNPGERGQVGDMQTLDVIENITLPDSSGRQVRIGDLWRESPAVIVWTRHFG